MRAQSCLAVLTLGLLAARSEGAAWPARVTPDSYDAGGHRIEVDHFEPKKGAVAKGAAVVLYGAGGMIFDGPRIRRVAQALAEDGYDVSLIHYFNRTGTLVTRDHMMQQNFTVWLDTVRQGIEHARSTHGQGRSVYVYGYSLGAFLAIAAASDNPGVAAVAEHAGGIWNNQGERIGRMPPVLIIHGGLDQRVPLDQYARPLQAELQRRKGSVKTHFYGQEGHIFSSTALLDVQREVPQFFDAHQGRKDSVAGPNRSVNGGRGERESSIAR